VRSAPLAINRIYVGAGETSERLSLKVSAIGRTAAAVRKLTRGSA
jgi:hypothetical protein